MGFQFEIVYKSSTENKVVDALSRIPKSKELNIVLSSPYWLDLDKNSEEIQEDSNLASLISSLKVNPSSYSDYIWHGGLLYYRGRLVLSKNLAIILDLLQEFHLTPTRGHSGFTRTYKQVAGSLFWQGMRKAVLQFVKDVQSIRRINTKL